MKFLVNAGAYRLFVTSTELVLVAPHGASNASEPSSGRCVDGLVSEEESDARGDVVRLHLVGASATARAEGVDTLPGITNYFVGNDRTKWRTNIPTYSRVRMAEVYPGIDVVYYGNGSLLEYDFVVAAGADPSRIRIRPDGAKSVRIDAATGDLLLETNAATMRQHLPRVYQQTRSGRTKIDARYDLRDGEVRFSVGSYDPNKPLVIDPVLVYSTYLGGSTEDFGSSIQVDSSGSAYITGSTNSTDFPTQAALQGSALGSIDGFVAKLNSSGTALVYSTYLGGGSDDGASSIAVDSDGNAYVTGYTKSTNFPIQLPAQPSLAGGDDAFVTKLDSTGSALIYSTYLGGTGADVAVGIAVDAGGSAFVAGLTSSIDLPTTGGALQSSFAGANDAFVTRLDTTGSALLYSTYLGGSASDAANGIAVDATSNAYVTGYTGSANFPTTPGALQISKAASTDAFVSRLNSTGSALVYSTFLGGSASDVANAIAVDSTGVAYVTGNTSSTDFPTLSASQGATAGSSDAFVTKLASTGASLLYSTYLGGTAFDIGNGIAVDATGSAWIAGYTNSTSFPTVTPVNATASAGDAFVSRLTPDGSVLVFSTYLGGSAEDYATGIAIDDAGAAYVTGYTTSTDFPTQSPLQGSNAGANDSFVLMLGAAADLSIVKSGPTTVAAGNPVTYSIGVTNNGPSDAQTVALSDVLPAGTTFVSLSSPGGWACSTPAAGGTGTVTCSIATLANGASATFTLVVNVDSSVASGTIVTNTASVSSTTADLTPNNNSGSAAVTVSAGNADLSITKTPSTAPYATGFPVTYTIAVNNGGPATASGVTVTDVIPAGATFVSATASQGNCTGTSTVTCALGTLANGASATISLVLRPTAPGGLSNTATVTSSNPDPNPANDSATATITVATIEAAAVPTLSPLALLLALAALTFLGMMRLRG